MHNSWQVSALEKEDIPAVALLEKAVFSRPWSQKMLEESWQQHQYFFAAIKTEEKLLGYGGIYQAADEANITNIGVQPEARRQGIGKALLSALLKVAEKRGCRVVFLEVRESNVAARTLYEKMGFVLAGIRKNYYTDPKENAVTMYHLLGDDQT